MVESTQVESLLEEALRKMPAERAAFLDHACEGNRELRNEVERLLAAYPQAECFLDRPAMHETAADLSRTEAIGTMIGPYKLLQQIGEGGMGTVFMAEQTEPVKRKVALKIIKPGMDSRQVIARFEAERQALALMDHPNIAKVLDAGATTTGRPYFVMELVKGTPITKFCDEKKLNVRERLELFGEVCRAVQHAHQKGIIHRDIKPNNVMVGVYDGRPVVKVIDFGVAKATGQKLTDATLFTGFGAVVGTPEYMSPEQAQMDNVDIDTRSDIYALGVLLYELLTGSTPLTRKRVKDVAFLEVLRVIREEEPPKPSTRLSSTEQLPSISAQRHTEPAKLTKLVRGELDWIVMKALEKDRNRRYETANGFAMDIQRYLADEAVLACPPSAGYRLRKFVRWNKGPVLAAAAVFLTLIAGVIGTTLGLIRAEDEKGRTQAALDAEARRRQQTRQALDDQTALLLDDLLAGQKELKPQHKQYLERALKAYEEFAADTGQDQASRAGVAKAYLRVGNIRERLGQWQDAEAAFRQALSDYEQLAVDFPIVPAYRRDMCEIYNNLGRMLAAAGRPKDAEAAYAAFRAINETLVAEFPTAAEYRMGRALNLLNLGALRIQSGQMHEAETACNQARILLEKLADDFPKVRHYRQQLALIHNNLAIVLGETGRPKAAEAAYERATTLQTKLADEFPTVPEFRQELARSYNNLANLLDDTGRPKAAEARYRQALIAYEKLANDFPLVPDYRYDLASSHSNLGATYEKTGRPKEAVDAYQRALTICEKLDADFPHVPDYRRTMATIHHNLGMLCDATGRPKEAEAAFGQALRIREKLAADFSSHSNDQYELASTLTELAGLQSDRGKLAEARQLLERAISHQHAALKSNPLHPEYPRRLCRQYCGLTDTLLKLGDYLAAAKTAQEIVRVHQENADDNYLTARFLARCATLAGASPQAKSADAMLYADLAMLLLRRAVEKGYQHIAHTKKDKDLDPLRGRQDFQQWLRELEAKAAMK